jgi:hypothetical protein
LLDAACIGGEGTRPASPCRETAGGTHGGPGILHGSIDHWHAG